MIAHHPDEDLLLSYASGAAGEALGLILATHLSFCPACRARVGELEAVGGALLDTMAPVALTEGAVQAALAKLDGLKPYPRPPRRAVPRDGTPAVLRDYIGGGLDQVRWRRMGPKLAYAPLFQRGPVRARLLRGAPGAESGPHSHQGWEYTLVLQGGFGDVTGSYGPGDLQVMGDGPSHNPIADPGEDCINLAVTTGRLKFDRLSQKIAGPLFGF